MDVAGVGDLVEHRVRALLESSIASGLDRAAHARSPRHLLTTRMKLVEVAIRLRVAPLLARKLRNLTQIGARVA
jgi:hypothetical protein